MQTNLLNYICIGILLLGYLPGQARAQSVATCQTTSAILYPPYSDASGWSPKSATFNTRYSMALGDIDGDGQDELVALMPGAIPTVQVWHWNQTGWTPMAAFPNALISNPYTTLLENSALNPTLEATLELADVDGDGQKEVVLDVTLTTTDLSSNPPQQYASQGQVYHYNKSTATWTQLPFLYNSMLGNQPGGFAGTWFKAHTTDVQETRLGVNQDYSVFLQQLVKDQWTSVPVNITVFADGPPDIACTQMAPFAYCVAFADVNGDGITDMIYSLQGKTYVVPSTASTLFGGTQITTSIPQIPTYYPPQSGFLSINQTSADGWQMGRVGELGSSLFFPTPDGALHAYSWNPTKNDFVAMPDPNNILPSVGKTIGAIPASYTITPLSLLVLIVDTPTSSSTFQTLGITVIGQDGVYLIPFDASTGSVTYSPLKLTSAISSNAGFGPTGYSASFGLAVEGQYMVMLARSANGVVNLLPEVNLPNALTAGVYTITYVDPETQTDRGYPAYSTSQQAAYQYIGANSAGNPDLRSLYPNPAVPWSEIQPQVASMAAPPASTGISAANFQAVRQQTMAEIAALQTVNQFYAVTGQILTNTYLAQDGALQEITDVLGLPSQPDVAQNTLNLISSAIGLIGAGLEGVGAQGRENLRDEVVDGKGYRHPVRNRR